MQPEAIGTALRSFLESIRLRLDQAVAISTEAEASATDGNLEKAVETVLDVEPLIREIGALVNAAKCICGAGERRVP